MNDELKNKIAQRLEDLRVEIVASIEDKGITASGRTQRSLEVHTDESSVSLVSARGSHAPIRTIEIGRPAGNVPGGFRTTKAGKRDVSNTFKAILVEWAKDKGMVGFGWGAATMLGRKIAEQGTARHRNNVDVYSTAVRKAADDIYKLVNDDVREFLNTSITKNVNF